MPQCCSSLTMDAGRCQKFTAKPRRYLVDTAGSTIGALLPAITTARGASRAIDEPFSQHATIDRLQIPTLWHVKQERMIRGRTVNCEDLHYPAGLPGGSPHGLQKPLFTD